MLITDINFSFNEEMTNRTKDYINTYKRFMNALNNHGAFHCMFKNVKMTVISLKLVKKTNSSFFLALCL